MAVHPADYPWSSYRANAQGEANSLITPHSVYQALGTDETQRQAAYRELFRYQLDQGLVDEIRVSTNGDLCLAESDSRGKSLRCSGGERGGAKLDARLKQVVMRNKGGVAGLRFEIIVVCPLFKSKRKVKTASQWQVRQPIYKTSKERWRNYEPYIVPLLELLQEEG